MANRFKLFIILFITSVSGQLFAGDETRSSRVYANNLVQSAFIQTEDDKFTGSAGWTTGLNILTNRGIVELGLDEEKHIVHLSPFTICATFDIEITDANLVVTTFVNQQLTINYNPQELTRYKDKAQIIYPNAYKIKVFNMSIKSCGLNTPCSSCNTPYSQPDVYIETNVSTAKAYTFNFSTTFASGDVSDATNSTNQELEIRWNNVLGAEEYELEYTYVDNYTFMSVQTNQKYDFNYDATRIVTPFNYFRIPLTYESGTIIYRVRPIGRSAVNIRTEGAWFGAPASGVISGAGTFTEAVSPFNGDLFNWSSVKTFAETGRAGTGVNFTDAMGFSRQSIARLNTDEKSIAQSVLYDYFGRPTINILPAPVSGKKLEYRINLNMYYDAAISSTTVFSKSAFGVCSASNNICASGAYTLDPIASQGAANYYSVQNPNKQAYHGYIADAEGIPYTQVKYKPDALGRIERQTLPGATHAIGTGKDIRYFYAQPTQVELDRLFGSEAGRAKYHFKHVVVDPNGQVSISYLDNFGRTVASFLKGTNPLNVDAVPNLVSTITLTETLEVPPTNEEDPDARCKEVNTTFFVSSASIEGYVYHTTLGSFASTCVTNPVCYDCVYDVELSIKDDCGNEIFDHDANSTTAPGYTNTVGKQPPYNAVECGSGPTSTIIAGANLNAPVSITFPKTGVYTVYKKICVSDAPLQDYTDHFIANLCEDKLCFWVDSIMSMTDFSACNTNTSNNCTDCMAAVNAYNPTNGTLQVSGSPINNGQGSILTHTTAVYASTLTPQQKSQALENCAKLCPPKTQCEKYTRALEMDFYPGGQYADTVVGGPNWAKSIFNSANTLNPFAVFTTPTNYKDAQGNTDYVQLNNVNVAIHNLSKINYIKYYRKSWAKSLLQYHPEYCKLNFYCNVIGTSKDYDEAMLGINHYDSACAVGRFFPIAVNMFSPTYSICAPQSCTTTVQDPIVNTATLSSNFNTTITAFVSQITTHFNALATATVPSFDIYRWVMAQTNTLAAHVTNINDWVGKDACRQDADWLRFRSAYLSKKASLYHKLDSIYFLNPAAYGAPEGCNGSSNAPSGYISHFPNVSATLAAAFPTSTASIYTMMNPPSSMVSQATSSTFSAAAMSASTTMSSSMNSTLTSQCTSACNSYTALWHNALNSGCIAYGNANQTVKNNIMNALVGVCISGCDYNTNLLGASTSSPNTSYLLPSTSQTVNSFQQVLNYYLTGNVTTSVCSAIILSQPGPYPVPTNTAQPLTSCKCDQVLQIVHNYSATSNPSGVNAEWKRFRHENGYDLPEFYTLKCICLGSAPSWAPGHIWTTPQLTSLAQNTFNVNPKLKCISCMRCDDVVAAIDGMYSQLPIQSYTNNAYIAITQDSTNQVYAIAALDNQFGPHAFQDYLDLYNDCKTFNTSAKTFSNTLTPKALELFKYLNQLVSDKFLTKNNRPAKVCTDSKYFLSNMYSGPLPNIPTNLTYSFYVPTSPVNVATLQITSPSSTLLSISLKFAGTYTGTWQSLKYLNNFVAWCPTPTAGNNYSFQVNAIDNSFAVVTLTGSVLNQVFPISVLSSAPAVPQLCPSTPSKLNKCTQNLIENALDQANKLNQQYLESIKAQFQNQYKDACYAAISETFKRVYNGADEYQHTLYYFDESGNLQRTVPPNGVKVLTNVVSPLTSVVYPLHSNVNGIDMRYVSDYRYTTYNQPTTEKTIDGGQSQYFYDPVGRIIASQNAKQAALSSGTIHVYSYTLYDDIGRISEVGQVTTTNSIPSATPFINYAAFSGSVLNTSSTRSQVTQTYYDALPSAIITPNAVSYFALPSNTLSNTRNRVVCTIYNDNTSSAAYQFASYYSYDDHGNVQRVTHENNTLTNGHYGLAQENLFKKIDYEYELISGNVKKATYQKNLQDQLIHVYYYDNDNRLHEVYSSFDNVNFDLDAKYFYYEHGPLARIERADKQVQGTDFMYTIHGWIKGINGEALDMNSDAGKDGTANTEYLSSYNSIHNYFAKDAMSYALNYYNAGSNTDYKAIKRGGFNTSTNQNPQISLTNLYNNTTPFYLDVNGAGNGASLFNGNISSMVTSFIDKDLGNSVAQNSPFAMITGYRYDQLHRLTKSRTFRSITSTPNVWDLPSVGNYDDSYKMDLSYDPNGNIQTLFRNGASPALKPGGVLAMDNLSYSYFKSVAEGGIVASNSYNSNKLACVTDAVTSTNYGDDIDTYASCTEANSRYT
ncbi:MAG: hypothetical protein ACK50A_01785, partial [Sphingobacteriaceae bacterium]